MTETNWCTNCGKYKPRHFAVNATLCCKCYVEAGNPPSDWHLECMKAYNERKTK